MNDLDDLARLIRAWGVVLAYGSDGATLAFRYRLPAQIRSAIRSRRRGLARLMQAGDVRLCPAPDLHRSSWYYAGQGRYTCSACQRIDAHQLGLWREAG